jgi:hypothetical protein
MNSEREPRAQQKPIPAVAAILLIVACGLPLLLTVLFLFLSPLTSKTIGTRDYVVYWATGRQLVNHANPYDGITLAKNESSQGFPAAYKASYMRNPPWILPLTYPLGLLGARVGWILWSLLLLCCLLVSVHLLWIMHGRPKNRRYLLGYTFAPALICLGNGQTAPLALLGLALFLRLHQTRPFLAGVSLWLCALKPNLFLPFGVALLAWILLSRSFKILAGAAVAMAASCALLYAIDPMAWSQYAEMMRTSGIEKQFIPCLGVALRLWLRPQMTGLQYLPAALGCAWALAYFWARRNVWKWMDHGSLLMLVSVLAAPYAWLYDAVVLIPALLHGAYLTRSRVLLASLALGSALIEIALLSGILKPAVFDRWSLLAAPAWLAWYLMATRNVRTQAD